MAKKSKKPGIEGKKVGPDSGVQASGKKKKRATKPSVTSKGC